jgi:predicted DNA-binding transcriptional regulator AlpA
VLTETSNSLKLLEEKQQAVSIAVTPEWIRINLAVKLFGLSRSKLYELITDRRIKSFTLRERNKIKGIRLINYDSLCQFLEREARAQEVSAQ